MENTKEMSIEDFCEEFDQVDDEATVIGTVFDIKKNLSIRCRKQNVEFWAGVDKGIDYFIDGTDVNFRGVFVDAVKCIKEEDDASADYTICDESGKILFLISVLEC